MNTEKASSLRTAVRICSRSVRAGAFACELATRRPWLGARDAHWIAENLSALRGWTVDVEGDRPTEETAALVIAEPSAMAALAVLASIPLGSMGPSLTAIAEPWWPHGSDGPVLLSSSDGEELGRLADRRAIIAPVAVEVTPHHPAGAPSSLWAGRARVTRARVRFGEPLELAPAGAGWDVAARARDEIERLLARAA